jgi:uncharacterized protein YndB with AHSA1/START domain
VLKIETSNVINRPVEEVFAAASNPEDGPKWSPGLVEVKKTSEGPIGVGSTYRLVRMFLGQRIEGDVELTEYEPNQKFTQDSKSRPFPVEARWTFDAVEGGTQVSVVLQAEPGGFFKLAEPLLRSFTKRTMETELASLKDLTEAHAL